MLPKVVLRFSLPNGHNQDYFFSKLERALDIAKEFAAMYPGKVECRCIHFKDDLGYVAVITNAFIACSVFDIEVSRENSHKYQLLSDEIDSRFTKHMGFGRNA